MKNRKPKLHALFTLKQERLLRKHGTPAEFAVACYEAVPYEMSMDESRQAVDDYCREWNEAAKKGR